MRIFLSHRNFTPPTAGPIPPMAGPDKHKFRCDPAEGGPKGDNARAKRVLIWLMIGLILSIAHQSFAAGSGGFRIEMIDAEAHGMGAAFAGDASNPSAIYYNPAGLTQLKGENHLSLGMGLIMPSITHESPSGVKTDMGRQEFFIPDIFLVSDFGLEKFVFGFGGTSSWGTGTEWSDTSFSRYVATRSDVNNTDLMFTGAYKVNDQLSLGLSVDHDYSVVSKSKKLLQGGVGDDGDYQLKGKGHGWGHRVALLYEINEQHQFGLQYRSPIEENYRGKTYLNHLNNAGATPYNTYFGGSSYETEISSESELPQSVVAGYCFEPNEKWTINFDLEWMDWSSIEQELIEYQDEQNVARLAVLNSGNPAPKDWYSAWSTAFGAEYDFNDKLRLRGGYYFHQTPIPDENFHSNLPDSNSHSLAVGFGYDLNDKTTFDLAYSHMFFEKQSITNSTAGASIDGDYTQGVNLLLVTLNRKF